MTRGSAKAERTLAAFLLGLLLLNPPLLSIFSRDASLFGLPLLYLYLFAAWGLIILIMALATGREPEGPARPPLPEGGGRKSSRLPGAFPGRPNFGRRRRRTEAG